MVEKLGIDDFPFGKRKARDAFFAEHYCAELQRQAPKSMVPVGVLPADTEPPVEVLPPAIREKIRIVVEDHGDEEGSISSDNRPRKTSTGVGMTSRSDGTVIIVNPTRRRRWFALGMILTLMLLAGAIAALWYSGWAERFGLGITYGPTPTPQTVVQRETIAVTAEVTREVTKEVTKVITQEVPVPVPQIVTVTPPPATATPASTSTPIPPTDTPAPAATTQPGVELKEGETWTGDGLALTVTEFCLQKCLPGSLGVSFQLENLTDQDILLPDIVFGELVVEFDTGQIWTPWRGSCAACGETKKSEWLKPGGKLTWTWNYFEDWLRPPPVDRNAKSFIVHAKKIGDRITNAKWIGVIPR